MECALAFLDNQSVTSVRLDATPLGQPLYEQLGFVRDRQIGKHRWVMTRLVERRS